MDFAQSKTRENLMRAFAGESQARNRYTFAASQAKKEKLHVIEGIFTFTANQEKEHAEIFYNLLTECAGENILVDGKYPVDISQNLLDLLKMARHNEYEEYEDVYASFAQVAQQEGFTQIANTFTQIAAIEKTHGDRFGRFADLVETGALFTEKSGCAWMCLNCGHIHTGPQAPQKCPVCQHDQGYFIRLDMAPFAP
ncbi:MAG: rubrerythrin [Christensenellales bacterium]|jgi:rubrerythrin